MVTSKDVMGREAYGDRQDHDPPPHHGQWQYERGFGRPYHDLEGIEVLPVVNEHHKLMGIVSRQDVLKALQMIQRQPQVGETIEDIITNGVQAASERKGEKETYQFAVTPQMTTGIGTISYGVFTTLMTEAANRALKPYKKGDIVIENMTIYFIKPVQMESMLDIHPKVLDVGRKFGKVDVEVYHDGVLVGKSLMICQLIDRH